MFKAAEPALAVASSSRPLGRPPTPIAPTTAPSFITATPQARAISWGSPNDYRDRP